MQIAFVLLDRGLAQYIGVVKISPIRLMVPVENCLLLYFVIGMSLLLVDTEKCGKFGF